jgi:hypothetical protein
LLNTISALSPGPEIVSFGTALIFGKIKKLIAARTENCLLAVGI